MGVCGSPPCSQITSFSLRSNLAFGAFLYAFFPFRDSIDRIADAGVKAVVQPGGSIRDDEVISACNEHGIAMVFTGKRCFKH